jgi:hypothetical protein
VVCRYVHESALALAVLKGVSVALMLIVVYVHVCEKAVVVPVRARVSVPREISIQVPVRWRVRQVVKVLQEVSLVSI